MWIGLTYCEGDIFHSPYSSCTYLTKTQECPTLWRIYDYVSDERRIAILEARKAKERLELGKGGEGFVGDDLWCYNCGQDGHLGDVSIVIPHVISLPANSLR